MKAVLPRVVMGVTLMLLWGLLSLPLSGGDAIVGAILVAVIVALPLPGPNVYAEIIPLPKRVFAGILFIFVFLLAVIKSNLDVAFRVLSPTLPINPGIVRVRTRLRTRIGRLILANSITLTPGTISVDIDGEDLYVHWINTEAADLEEATRKIVTGFERYLEVCFG